QGLALDGDALYVADTENHLLRRVDLKARMVETVAGTGAQARSFDVAPGPARTVALSSPWDLQLVGRALYVAMAGVHQIWRYDLDSRQIPVFAGTGRDAREDGRRTLAPFAQPSGLSTDLRYADGARAIADTCSRNSKRLDPKTGAVQNFAGTARREEADRAQSPFYQPCGFSFPRGKHHVAHTNHHANRVLDAHTDETSTL